MSEYMVLSVYKYIYAVRGPLVYLMASGIALAIGKPEAMVLSNLVALWLAFELVKAEDSIEWK